MTDPHDPQDADKKAVDAPDAAPATPPGDRLAKVIARAGLGSRREAEAWIGEGRVAVNGKKVDSAALNVVDADRITVDGRPLPARERTRLWLYHKPRGYVTTTHDPEGRETVFDVLPPGLPRVVSIGRLDINTEGLLLLTNDGGLARVLELPETGWLRRYRVRAFGRVTQEMLNPLADGVAIDGFNYSGIEAEIERQQNDNVWLRIGLREGKNREVKRVAEHLGLAVNRLIRISFGPFQLGDLEEGQAEEVRAKVLMEQLGRRLVDESGADFAAEAVDHGADAPRVTGGRGAGRGVKTVNEAIERGDRARFSDPSQRVGRKAPIARPRDMAAPSSVAAPEAPAERAPRVTRADPVADRKGRKVKVERVARTADDGAPKRVHRRDPAAAERFGAPGRPPREPRPAAAPRDAGDRPARSPRPDGAAPRPRPGGSDRPRTGRTPPDRTRPRAASGEARPYAPRADRPDRAEGGAAKTYAPRGDRPAPAERKPYAPRTERPERIAGAKPYAPRTDRSRSDRPASDRPFGDTPLSARPSADRPRPDAGAPRPPRAPRWRDDAAPRPERSGDDRPRAPRPPAGERPARRDDRPRSDRPATGEGPARAERPAGDRPATGGRPAAKPFRAPGGRGGKPVGTGRPARGAPGSDRPSGGAKPGGKPRPSGGKPFGGKPSGDKPSGGGGRGRPGGADRRR